MNSQVDQKIMEGTQAPGWRPGVLVLIVLGLIGTGCTSRQLQTSAARQAQTVVDLEYQQILDNLAMYSLNRDAMPSLAMLKTGATQVGDTGQIGFVGTAGLGTNFGSSPTLSGTRTIVDQWGSSPMTDDNNLMLVRKAFRCALGYKDLLDDDDANDLAHDLSAQIGTTSDMSVDQDTLSRIYSQANVSAAVNRLMPAEEVQKNRLFSPPPGASEREIQHTKKANMERELERISQQLALTRDLIGKELSDTLDHEILAKSYAIDFRRKLDVLLVDDNEEMIKNLRQGKYLDESVEDTLAIIKGENTSEVLLFDHDGKSIISQKLTSSNLGYSEMKKALENFDPYEDLGADDKREILEATVNNLGLKPMLHERFEPLGESATGLAKEAIYRVNDAQKTLDEINPGWFRCGPEKPKDACYSGHAKFCGQECYVWVCRDGLDDLEEFTRKVLKLGTTLKDVQVVTAPSGIQFAPALNNGR